MNNRIISHKLFLTAVTGRFMDIYTIGRILKPGYNCVLHGGAFHTIDTLKTLEKHGLISSKNPQFWEIFDQYASNTYKEVTRDINEGSY